tara:strand:+ start:221 stop:493 length:273 start_codon:yes stop_codon:yes gene_type:complete
VVQLDELPHRDQSALELREQTFALRILKTLCAMCDRAAKRRATYWQLVLLDVAERGLHPTFGDEDLDEIAAVGQFAERNGGAAEDLVCRT